MKPQDIAQKVKAGRGWLVVRNSATLADTDYEKVADEIVDALNKRRALTEASRAFLAWASSGIDGMPDADQLAVAVEKARSALGLS